MNPKILHNLTMVPFLIIGLMASILGVAWLTTSEPWMLDKSANVILLDESYSDLFSEPINRNLPKYLTLLYRFFGVWVTSLGLLILGFTIVTRMGTVLSRGIAQTVTLFTLIGISTLEAIFIPSSPFVYVTILLWILWIISVFAGIGLRKHAG